MQIASPVLQKSPATEDGRDRRTLGTVGEYLGRFLGGMWGGDFASPSP